MATYTYGYTVSAYSDYISFFSDNFTSTQGSLSYPEWYQYSDNSPTNADDIYVPSKTESLSTTPVKLTFKKDMRIVYYLRFYMKKVDGAQTDYFWLTDDAVKNIKINEQVPSKLAKIKGVDTIKPGAAFEAGGEGTAYTKQGFVRSRLITTTTPSPKLYGVTSGHCFVFVMNAKAAGVVSKGFTIDAEITPSNYSYGQGATAQVTDPASTPVIITNDIITSSPNNGTSAVMGIKPTITITAAEVEAVVNANFKATLQSRIEASGFLNVSSIAYDRYKGTDTFEYAYGYNACATDPAKAWVGVKWGKTYDKNDVRKPLVRFSKIYGSKNGQDLLVIKAVDEKFSAKSEGLITSEGLQKALAEVIAARKGNCKTAEDGNGKDDDGDDDANNNVGIESPVQPEDNKRWNPPPHVDARGVDYFTRVGQEINTGQFFSARGQALDPSDFRNIVNTYLGTRPERGRIFQDKITARIMNETKLSIQTKPANVLQWGFRFMYNPEMVTYESADSGVDWTYGSQDVSVNMSGNQTVSFDLLINRIPDMSYLKLMNAPWTGSSTPATRGPSFKSVYGRDLADHEKEGIINRGTEYDIEYLYRVLTGDPVYNSLLLEPGYGAKGLTADKGYTTKVPVWLFLNENMRYYGSVNSISVTHRIFDQNMVPMLSRVGISFSRYPAVYGNTPTKKTTAEGTGK